MRPSRPSRTRASSTALALVALVLTLDPASAQQPAGVADTRRLSVERIFGGRELAPSGAPGVRWMRDGRSYVEARGAAGGGTDIVRVDAVTGVATVLVPASALLDEARKPIDVEELELSPDERRALLFHSSVRVWRSNTRGTYHVVDLDTRRVTPIATITTPGTGASRAADSIAAPALGNNATAASSPSFIGRGLASGAADAEPADVRQVLARLAHGRVRARATTSG